MSISSNNSFARTKKERDFYCLKKSCMLKGGTYVKFRSYNYSGRPMYCLFASVQNRPLVF